MKKKSKGKTIPFEALTKEWMKDPEYKAAYDALAPKYAVYEALIKAQKESGLTHEQIAARMGASRPVLTRFLSAKHPPKWDTIERFAKALGLKPVLHFEKDNPYYA